MRILIAAGGTGGHVNPALAIAQAIKNLEPEADILFVGRRDGMEYGLVTAAGYPFEHVEVRGFQRTLSLENIKRNTIALFDLAFASGSGAKILKNFKPDLCIGAGGYVTGPILRVAAKKGYKTVIHEQNAYPGVTNKLLARGADIVFAASAAAAKRLGCEEKTIVVGNPVRQAVFEADAACAKKEYGAAGRPVILSFGGSLGAAPLNRAVAELAAWLAGNENCLHIHATGKAGAGEFAALLEKFNLAPNENFIVQQYITDMPRALAAADLVIARAGALTLSELAAAGRAAILIPSPYVSENHQYYNALEVVQAGAALMLEEKDLTGSSLIAMVQTLVGDRAKLTAMGKKAKSLATPDSAQIIAQKALELIKN
ncbi:undecaprenyldiphospho-muramoylpentapeptide beta-N-acetylglucosaminyltransferase [Ruminococcaceae bacterium OttesenSCG-928-N02]|nr:undecaprenyldiphospho-muramoylpentapeptide beta-N-acetylglucosaminyltransferase [Ruminococcaceae bacterium OttesenSCG-928-N02]